MSCRPVFALVCLAIVGCAGVPAQKTVWSQPPANVRGVVLSADGAGNFGRSSEALRQAIMDARAPLLVEAVSWSHGNLRLFADQMDYEHARAEGYQLAAQIRERRQAWPAGRINLVGYSAGSAVVLSALESLPPGSVDSAVLLAPSVSAHYDLRPALGCCPIHVFYSTKDRFYLGVGIAIVGTTDRHWLPAAGQTGFLATAQSIDDQALYARLHQHLWSEADEQYGNRGGHYGSTQPAFLRARVVPLLATE